MSLIADHPAHNICFHLKVALFDIFWHEGVGDISQAFSVFINIFGVLLDFLFYEMCFLYSQKTLGFTIERELFFFLW